MVRKPFVAALALGLGACSGPVVQAGPDASAPDAGVELADAAEPAGPDASSGCQGLCELTLVAGTPGGRGAVDGTGDQARMRQVLGMSGGTGTLLFGDLSNGAIRELDPTTGVVRTVAGQLGMRDWHSLDGLGTAATFSAPGAMAELNGTLFVGDLDFAKGRLRRISTATWQVTTVTDPATGQPWSPPGSLPLINALATAGGKLYIAGIAGVWSYDPKAKVFAAVAGSADTGGYVDAVGAAARFIGIFGMASDGANSLFVSDSCVVRKIDLTTNAVSTIAGAAAPVAGGATCTEGRLDGVGTAATFMDLWGIAWDGTALFVTEQQAFLVDPQGQLIEAPRFGAVRRIDPVTKTVKTLAGAVPQPTAQVGELDGAGTDTRFLKPEAIWADAHDNVYVGTLSTVRRISKKTGDVQAVAGKLAASVLLMPSCVAIDGDALYAFLEQRGAVVRVDLNTGAIQTAVSYNATTFPADQCAGATIQGGAMYVGNVSNNEVLRVELATGKVTSLARLSGSLYSMSFDGQKLVAVERLLTTDRRYQFDEVDLATGAITLLAVTTAVTTQSPTVQRLGGVIYLTDEKRVAKLNVADKSLTTVAGSATSAGCQDGALLDARFSALEAIATDGTRLFVADWVCHRVSAIDLAQGTVTSLVGSPSNPVFAPGQAEKAGVSGVGYLTWDPVRKALFASDPGENILVRIAAPAH